MLSGAPERATHDYKRAGTFSLYAALDIITGKVIEALLQRHRAIEFKKFLQAIDREVRVDLDVHVVLDNSSTHKTPAIKTWLLAHPQFVLHFTPTSLSWLNLVERWFLRADDQEATPRCVPLCPPAQHRHPPMDRHLKRRSQTPRMDQDHRPDPQIDRPLLRPNQRITT
jgi:DDE superfamily endonuclease